jgi:uncharacterized protein
MKKRLRKKLYIKEYKELNFSLKFQFIKEISEEQFDTFVDSFFDLLEDNELTFGGGASEEYLRGVVSAKYRYESPTEENVKMVNEWLKSRDEVAEFVVGELIDSRQQEL